MIAAAVALLAVLLATFVYTGMCAGEDALLIKQDANISHLWQARQRGAAIGGFVLAAYAPLLLLRYPSWYTGLAPLAAAAACLCLFGTRFDIRLNLRRGLDKFYLGTDAQTASTDKAVTARGISGRTFAWLKLAGVVTFAAAALLLSGCRAGRDVAGPGATAEPTPTLSPASSYAKPQPPAPNALAREQKEYRKNLKEQSKAAARIARAQPRTVPLIQGRAAVNAPLASQVLAAYKPRGPVVQADTGAVVQVAVAAKNAQAAAGEGNVQQRMEAPKRTIWQRVTGLLTGLTSALSWLLLGAVLLHALGPGLGYGSGWLRRVVSRRRV